MTGNEYRRALILLRAVRAGLGGHARLERRWMTGSIQCTVTGLEERPEEVFACIAARLPGGWKVVRLGRLAGDGRRQAGLRRAFDPRSIEGLPLEDYQVLAVAGPQDGECRLLLFGFLNGSMALDLEELGQAVCGDRCAIRNGGSADAVEDAPREPSAGPAGNAAAPRAEADGERLPPTEGGTEALAAATEPGAGDAASGPCGADRDGREPASAPAEGTAADSDAAATAEQTPAQGTADLPAAAEPNPGRRVSPGRTGIAEREAPQGTIKRPIAVPEPADTAMEAPAEAVDGRAENRDASESDDLAMSAPAAAVTALERLGMAPGVRWPESIEPLRALFMSRPPVQPAPAEGYVFVQTAPTADGRESLVGVRAGAEGPAAVAYAVASRPGEERPAGMEGYLRRAGWWLTFADADTGAMLEDGAL